MNITTTITSAFSPDQRLPLWPDQREALRSDQAADINAKNEKEPRKSKLRRRELQGEDDDFSMHQLNSPKKMKFEVGGGKVKSLINLWSSEPRNSDDVSRAIQTTKAAKLQPITDQFRNSTLPSTFVTKICNSVIGQEDEQVLKPANGMKPTKQQDYRN